MPHKPLPKTPIKILLGKNAVEERTNLRPFGQQVACLDYEITDKLSPFCFGQPNFFDAATRDALWDTLLPLAHTG